MNPETRAPWKIGVLALVLIGGVVIGGMGVAWLRGERPQETGDRPQAEASDAKQPAAPPTEAPIVLEPSTAPGTEAPTGIDHSDDKPLQDAHMAALKAFLEEGRRIRAAYVETHGSEAAKKQADEWYARSLDYIQKNLGDGYVARYKPIYGRIYQTNGFPRELMPVIQALDGRMEHLMVFLEEQMPEEEEF